MNLTNTLINNPMIKQLLETTFKAGYVAHDTEHNYNKAIKKFFDDLQTESDRRN